MPLSEILSLYYLLTLYLLHIAFSFRTCGFPKLCSRAEFSWLENALILFRVLPNPSLLKRGIEMHYSTTHGQIPSAYCTQTHHEFSRAPYASERGNCKCMNQGIERNIKQADRGLKNKETERIRACLRPCRVWWLLLAGMKKKLHSSSFSLSSLPLPGGPQTDRCGLHREGWDCW